jgi:Universal stress protein family
MIKVHEIAEGTETPIPTNKKFVFKNILLATDFLLASDRALEYATSLARRYCSTIYLTHIITRHCCPTDVDGIRGNLAQKNAC